MQASIDKGKWLAGEKIPSIRTLSQSYDCSKNTVIRALQSLEASGAISAREKVGYFVNQTRITETIT
ncbi:MAG: winged helix-turn-helix domain-containing protein, partial [Kangiellaceae bacterium]